MNWFMNMRLSSKLVLSFVIVLALTTFLGIFSIMKLAAVYKTTLDLATDYVPGLQALAEIRNALNQERRWELRIAMATDQADRENSQAQIEIAQENMKKAQAKYEPTVRDEEEKKLYQAVLAAVKDYNAVSSEAIASYRRGDKTRGYQLLSVNGLNAFNQVTKAQQELVDFQERATAEASKQGVDIYNKGRLWVTGAPSSAPSSWGC